MFKLLKNFFVIVAIVMVAMGIYEMFFKKKSIFSSNFDWATPNKDSSSKEPALPGPLKWRDPFPKSE